MKRWICREIVTVSLLSSMSVSLFEGSGVVAAGTPMKTAAVLRCHTGQLTINPDSSNSGLGHVGRYFRIHNQSPQTCTLFGYPGVQLLDRYGRKLPTVLRWGVGYLSGRQARRLVYLRPGGNAFFFLEWVHFPTPGQSCPGAFALSIIPPNAYRAIRVQMAPSLVDACGGILNAGPVEPTRVP